MFHVLCKKNFADEEKDKPSKSSVRWAPGQLKDSAREEWYTASSSEAKVRARIFSFRSAFSLHNSPPSWANE